MRKSMYAFSGDPITYGHIDIVERVAGIFDKVIVGIGANPDKKYTFSLEERTDMAKRSLAKFSNVRVVSFKGLLVDYAYENRVSVIVKGVRNAADVEYEKILHQVGDSQKLGIDTHMLFARTGLDHISSSAAKALQKEQGLIHEYVPLYVKQKLEAKISGQYILGVTGEIGSGKSYISKKIEELGRNKGINVYNIELDTIGHQILGELTEPKYHEVRQKIADVFGKEVRLPDGKINRKALGEIVFNDSEKLIKLDEIMYTPLLLRLRRELYGKKGLILFNAALIAEAGLAYLCNNNVLLLKVNKQSQERRLKERNLSSEQIERRLASQYNFEQKKAKLEEAIEKDKQGKVWVVDNSDESDEAGIKNAFEEIVRELDVK
jgi:pantetheine-phosphate adenylyltransferase